MLDLLTDFLFPKFCVGCGKTGNDLCRKCYREMPISEQICPMCGRESMMGWTHEKCKANGGMDGLIVIYDYQDELVRKIIENIKFGFNMEMIKRVLKNFRFESGLNFDCLIPVPLYFYRKNWRGFNQAEKIADLIGEKMKIEVKNVLARKRNTKQQALLADREEREKNVKEAFRLVEGENMRGNKALLIDDVFTSGADMRECTKVLKKAGIEVVWGLALAH